METVSCNVVLLDTTYNPLTRGVLRFPHDNVHCKDHRLSKVIQSPITPEISRSSYLRREPSNFLYTFFFLLCISLLDFAGNSVLNITSHKVSQLWSLVWNTFLQSAENEWYWSRCCTSESQRVKWSKMQEPQYNDCTQYKAHTRPHAPSPDQS